MADIETEEFLFEGKIVFLNLLASWGVFPAEGRTFRFDLRVRPGKGRDFILMGLLARAWE